LNVVGLYSNFQGAHVGRMVAMNIAIV